MWGRLTSYLSGKGNDGGPSSPAQAYGSPTGTGADGPTGPHTLLVHFVLHDAESADASRLLADVLSREFAFGMRAVHCWKSTGDLATCVQESPLFSKPADGPKAPGFDDGDAESDAAQPAALLARLYADGHGIQRFAVAHALEEPTSHVVILADKGLTSVLLPAVRDLNPELAVSCVGGLPRQVCCRPGTVSVVADSEFAHTDGAAHGPAYSDADDADDADGGLGDTAHFSLRELSSPAGFNAVHGRLRHRILALGEVRRSDGAAVSMGAPSPQGEEMSAATPAMLSCQSRWELLRLRSQQLTLLRAVAKNLHQALQGDTATAATAANFRSINAGTERFYESLGRYPAAVRVLFNLGYQTPKQHGVLEYTECAELEPFRVADRTRTLALLDDLLESDAN